jgi:hypothetical protein
MDVVGRIWKCSDLMWTLSRDLPVGTEENYGSLTQILVGVRIEIRKEGFGNTGLERYRCARPSVEISVALMLNYMGEEREWRRKEGRRMEEEEEKDIEEAGENGRRKLRREYKEFRRRKA